MCIIAIKPAGVAMPKRETIRAMWEHNPHGAGVMWDDPDTHMVRINKGFMTFGELTRFLDRLTEETDLTNRSVIMHFRITTHGGTCPANTHPFPVSTRMAKLRTLNSTCRVGMVHNGIIPITPRAGVSDTMEFVATVVAPLAHGNASFVQDDATLDELAHKAKSKLAFLTGDGDIRIRGDFVKATDGLTYSNRSFEPDPEPIRRYRQPMQHKLPKQPTSEPRRQGCPPVIWTRWLMPLDYNEDCIIIEEDGQLVEPFGYCLDSNGRLYEVDFDTGTAHASNAIVLGSVHFDASFAEVFSIKPFRATAPF